MVQLPVQSGDSRLAGRRRKWFVMLQFPVNLKGRELRCSWALRSFLTFSRESQSLNPDISLLFEGCLANFIRNKALGQNLINLQKLLDTDGVYVQTNPIDNTKILYIIFV